MRFLVLVAALAFVPTATAQTFSSTFTWPTVQASNPGDAVTCHVGVDGWPAITSFQLILTPSLAAVQAVEFPPAAVVTSSTSTSTDASYAVDLAAPATLNSENLVLATITFTAPGPHPGGIGVYIQTTGPAGTTLLFGHSCSWYPTDAFTASPPVLEKWGAQVDAHRVAGGGTQRIRTLLANTDSVEVGATVTALLTSPDGLQYMRSPQVGWPPVLLGPGASAEFEMSFDQVNGLAITGGWTAVVRAWALRFTGMVGSERSKTLHYRVAP